MAFFDWNRDGKLDAQDMFLEYNIFKACNEDNNDKNGVKEEPRPTTQSKIAVGSREP